jgi:AraC family transcriptional regulator
LPEVVIVLPRHRWRATVDVGAGRWQGWGRPGDLWAWDAGCGADVVIDVPHDFTAVAIPSSVLFPHMEEASPGFSDFGRLHAAPFCDEAIEGLCRGLWTEAARGSPLGSLFADSVVHTLALALLRKIELVDAGPTPSNSVRGGLAPWQVREVTDYLDDQIATDVSLADLAAITGLSTFHLCRAFKQSTGMPPHRWRLARRVERARDMLENTQLPVTEVAARVGYDDPSQFAAAFRRALGMSPTEYRRERRS